MRSFYEYTFKNEYWNIGSWLSYAREYVIPLYVSTQKLLMIYEYLKTLIGGESIKLYDLRKKNKKLYEILLDGITDEGKYSDKSFAGLYSRVFGVYVDPEKWSRLKREEGEKNASKKIGIEIVKSQFMSFVEKLNALCLDIIKILGIDKEIKTDKPDVKEFIKDRNKLLHVLKELYNACINVCAVNNDYTFFIFSTNKLPRQLMEIAYPKLRTMFDKFRGFLGMEKIFEPNVDDPDFREAYTIWVYSEDYLGGKIYRINELIMKEFYVHKEVWEQVVENPIDPGREYVRKALDIIGHYKTRFLPQYVVIEKTYDDIYVEEKCRLCDKENRDYMQCYSFEYIVKSKEVTAVTHRIKVDVKKYSSPSHPLKIDLASFLNDIFPLLFTKIIDIDVNDNTISISYNRNLLRKNVAIR
ncbi:hypothetical protein J4526_07585 [Desulfurococcaceae archaeon MEX13E-LK6-19]|nr:hypothetical protein J4526_07585 [Desulfurococcaceae archaeon MEX13E-LK6-19]